MQRRCVVAFVHPKPDLGHSAMGTTFKYIDDSQLTLNGEEGDCEICGQTGRLYYVFLHNDDLEPPEYLCVNCFKTQPLDWFEKHDEESANIIAKTKYPEKADRKQRRELANRLLEEYRRTPALPNLVNWGEWPVCCEDFTEYLGDAEWTYSGDYSEFQWYGSDDHCDAKWTLAEHVEMPNFKNRDPFSLFRCLTCQKKYWIHCV